MPQQQLDTRLMSELDTASRQDLGLARVIVPDVARSYACGQDVFALGPLYLTLNGEFFGWVVDKHGRPK